MGPRHQGGRIRPVGLPEVLAQLRVDGQCLRVPTGRRETTHEEGGQRFVRRQVPAGVTQVVEGPGVELSTGGEGGLDPEGHQVAVQASRRSDHGCRAVVGPEGDSTGCIGRGARGVARPEGRAGVREKVLRSHEVDVEAGRVEPVAAGGGGEGQAEPSGPGDEGVQRSEGVGGWCAVPDLVDEPGDGDDATAGEQQRQEQCGQS